MNCVFQNLKLFYNIRGTGQIKPVVEGVIKVFSLEMMIVFASKVEEIAGMKIEHIKITNINKIKNKNRKIGKIFLDIKPHKECKILPT